MVIWSYYCVKGLLSTSTYAGFCRIIEPFHIPLWRQFFAWIVSRFSRFTSDPFSPPHIWVSCRWSLFGSSFCLFIYGRASLVMEGKSVVPMEITFLDMEDEYKKYGILRSLRYFYIQIHLGFGFFLRLAQFSFSEKLRGHVGKIYHRHSNINQTEYRIVTHNNTYFVSTRTYSTSEYCF